MSRDSEWTGRWAEVWNERGREHLEGRLNDIVVSGDRISVTRPKDRVDFRKFRFDGDVLCWDDWTSCSHPNHQPAIMRLTLRADGRTIAVDRSNGLRWTWKKQ